MRTKTKAYSWVPTTYLAEALPNQLVTMISMFLLLDMGVTKDVAAFYIGWLQLPWVFKFLWSPFIDTFKTKRWWILTMEVVICCGFALCAFLLNTAFWLQALLALFFIIAFSSATHDVAVDGFYVIALSQSDQSLYVGIRNFFYRVGMVIAKFAIVALAGVLMNPDHFGLPIATSWMIALLVLTVLFVCVTVWNFVGVPKTEEPARVHLSTAEVANDLLDTFRVFLRKPHLVSALLFIFLFRFPEAQLNMMTTPFLKDTIANGGLAMTNEEMGVLTGILGVIGLLVGGIVGGICVNRHGFKRWLWPMVLSISVPDLVYVYLSLTQVTNLWIVGTCFFIEQLGYGFGFTACSLFLVYFATGQKSTSVLSICTAIQYAGMLVPGMFAGYICNALGYVNFFWWIMLCCLVTFIVSAFIKIDPTFGIKEKE
jgi:PAT family beta-lactamase induction signal transducer AmpG